MSFIGHSGAIGLTDGEIVERAWSLDEVDELYRNLVDRFSQREPRNGQDALRALLELDEALQWLPRIDPQLPEELAPDRSSRQAARKLLDLRVSWLASAREYWEGLIHGSTSSRAK